MHNIAGETRTSQSQPLQLQLPESPLLIFVWIATLLLSSLPSILLQETHVLPNFPIMWMRIGLLVGFIFLSCFWKTVQPLRTYFTIFLVLYGADAVFNWLGGTAEWQNWFANSDTFTKDIVSSQFLRLGTALIMIAASWLILGNRTKFFLARGDLNATAEPVRWLGMERPTSWRRFGLILSICITLGTLTFLIVFSQPVAQALFVLPFLPFIVLAAALNAFSEEVIFRAALLGPLVGVVGKSQALLLTAMLFGLWHYYGVPYGILGVLMSGVLGWLLGKSMLETRGMFWAWFIHFWQDIAIFTFIALGSIVLGG
jgi:membrane protease YdiL (CAAX protease family)